MTILHKCFLVFKYCTTMSLECFVQVQYCLSTELALNTSSLRLEALFSSCICCLIVCCFQPKVVTDTDETELARQLERLERENAEVDGDDDAEEMEAKAEDQNLSSEERRGLTHPQTYNSEANFHIAIISSSLANHPHVYLGKLPMQTWTCKNRIRASIQQILKYDDLNKLVTSSSLHLAFA